MCRACGPRPLRMSVVPWSCLEGVHLLDKRCKPCSAWTRQCNTVRRVPPDPAERRKACGEEGSGLRRMTKTKPASVKQEVSFEPVSTGSSRYDGTVYRSRPASGRLGPPRRDELCVRARPVRSLWCETIPAHGRGDRLEVIRPGVRPVATFSPPGAVLRCRASFVAYRWLFSAAKHSGHKVERKLVKLRCFERRTSLGGCTSANAQQPTKGVDPGDLSRRTRSVLEADTSHETQMPIARAKSASAR